MTEQIINVTFVALFVPLCCYLLSVIPRLETRSEIIADDVMATKIMTREVMWCSQRAVNALDSMKRKPRYRVANAITKLPRRKSKCVVTDGY